MDNHKSARWWGGPPSGKLMPGWVSVPRQQKEWNIAKWQKIDLTNRLSLECQREVVGTKGLLILSRQLLQSQLSAFNSGE